MTVTVKAWPDWPTLDPSHVSKHPTVEEAIATARQLDEPLVDVIVPGKGVVAVRRLKPHPGDTGALSLTHDDFPKEP